MEVLLNVRVDQEKRAAKLALMTLKENLEKVLGFALDLEIDWDFTNHSEFTMKSLEDQSKIIRAIYQTHFPRVLISNDGSVTRV